MIIILKKNITTKEKKQIESVLNAHGFSYKYLKGENQIILMVDQDTNGFEEKNLERFPTVIEVKKISSNYPKVQGNDDTKIVVGNVTFSKDRFVIIAGPCSVESYEQLSTITKCVKENNASILRGGAFKLRTSPYSYQGLHQKGLELLKQCKKEYDIPLVSEIVKIDDIPLFNDVDMIQVGARNMQNFELLKELGKINKPILLKRGMGNTIDELLQSAEYIVNNGNKQVVLCERGIQTFEKSTRYTLDLSAIPVIKSRTSLPVIVDPSHALGRFDYIKPMVLASIAAGADGVILEVHNDPINALSDGIQAIDLQNYKDVVKAAKKVCKAVNRRL